MVNSQKLKKAQYFQLEMRGNFRKQEKSIEFGNLM